MHRATAFEADLQHLLGSAYHQLHMALAAEAPLCHKAQPARDKSLSLQLRASRGSQERCACRPEWRPRVEQRSPAVAAYVEHLADISSTDPVRLIAHAYTQHMALLAGGQRIRKFVASTLPGLQGQEAVSVFSFEVMP